jgi:hypothetical protein
VEAGLRTRTLLGILLALVFSLSGWSLLEPRPDECHPVDVGAECFAPSREGFIEHALEV